MALDLCSKLGEQKTKFSYIDYFLESQSVYHIDTSSQQNRRKKNTNEQKLQLILCRNPSHSDRLMCLLTNNPVAIQLPI